MNKTINMKTIKTIIPEGWEIDKEKSTFEEIVLKQSKKELPKTWRELKEINGWYVDQMSAIFKYVHGAPLAANKNTFATESQAKAAIALAQLSQLREVYRDGWKPESENEYKYIINCEKGGLSIGMVYGHSYFLSFQSEEIAQEFLTNFRDLIIEAAPLLFGEEIKQ
jgi:hypothetical protein